MSQWFFSCWGYLQHLRFNKFKIRTYKNPELCQEALSRGSENGGIAALLSVRPYTNLFLSKYGDSCTTVSPIYPTDGFACAFPKGSPLVAVVSRTLIELMESVRIFETEGQWNMNSPAYSNDLDGTSGLTRISWASFKVLFAITGSITTTCLAIFVMKYLSRGFGALALQFGQKLLQFARILTKETPSLLGTDKKGEMYEQIIYVHTWST